MITRFGGAQGLRVVSFFQSGVSAGALAAVTALVDGWLVDNPGARVFNVQYFAVRPEGTFAVVTYKP